MNILHSTFAAIGILALGGFSASAQQVTGVPGSPSATTIATGEGLPSKCNVYFAMDIKLELLAYGGFGTHGKR
jgi:hypothetical protein